MLRKTLNFLTLSTVNRSSSLIITRNYAPRYKREPGIQNRIKDFGEDFVENEDPEFVVSFKQIKLI